MLSRPRVENHAFVEVELADIYCVVSRDVFHHDSGLVHFSKLCTWSKFRACKLTLGASSQFSKCVRPKKSTFKMCLGANWHLLNASGGSSINFKNACAYKSSGTDFQTCKLKKQIKNAFEKEIDF